MQGTAQMPRSPRPPPPRSVSGPFSRAAFAADINARGGAATLVRLLAPGASAQDQQIGAGAMAILGGGIGITEDGSESPAPDARAQESIRAAGGIAALVRLLALGGAAGVQWRAAKALASLCADNPRNEACVREAGGVAALVRLLAPGGAAEVQEATAWALASLCQGRVRYRV